MLTLLLQKNGHNELSDVFIFKPIWICTRWILPFASWVSSFTPDASSYHMISMKKRSTLVCKAGGPQEKHPCNSQKPEKYESHKPLELVLTGSLSHLGKWGTHTLHKSRLPGSSCAATSHCCQQCFRNSRAFVKPSTASLQLNQGGTKLSKGCWFFFCHLIPPTKKRVATLRGGKWAFRNFFLMQS